MTGVMEFIDTSDMTTMANVEHYMATDVEWDPTGRYFMSCVSFWAHKVDNGYNIWSFQGRQMQKHSLDQFCQFLWRPSPPSLLTKEDIERIKKNMKKYQKKFEEKDRMLMSNASKELMEKRRASYEKFQSMRAKHKVIFDENREKRIAFRDGVCTDNVDSNSDDIDEETIEFFIKEQVELVDTET